jgi:hypothetical protein
MFFPGHKQGADWQAVLNSGFQLCLTKSIAAVTYLEQRIFYIHSGGKPPEFTDLKRAAVRV